MIEIIPDKDTTLKDCEQFILGPTKGRVIKVYDVDTITIAFNMSIDDSQSVLYKSSCRILGIDGPEMKSKKKSERKIAKMGQQYLYKLLFGKIVTLQNHQKEKYGRILADVYLENIKVSELILNNRFAVEYDGGKKQPPKNWERFHKKGKMRFLV